MNAKPNQPLYTGKGEREEEDKKTGKGKRAEGRDYY